MMTTFGHYYAGFNSIIILNNDTKKKSEPLINLHFSLLTAPCILLAPRLTLTFENKNKTHNAKRRAKRAQTTLSYIKMTFHSFSFRAIFLLAIAVVVVVVGAWLWAALSPHWAAFFTIFTCFLYFVCFLCELLKILHDYLLG